MIYQVFCKKLILTIIFKKMSVFLISLQKVSKDFMSAEQVTTYLVGPSISKILKIIESWIPQIWHLSS